MHHLISGAAGFIGSHLCDRLLADGGSVVALDNLITGSRKNLAHLEANPKFAFYEFDVTQPVSIEGKFDHVWHLASLASPLGLAEILGQSGATKERAELLAAAKGSDPTEDVTRKAIDAQQGAGLR